APRGSEGAEHRELLVRWRLGGLDLRGVEEREPGVLAHRLGANARVQRLDPHALGVGVEAEDAERGDHARDAAEVKTGRAARAVAREPRRARDEVDALDEATLLVRGHDDDLATQRGDIVSAAPDGQP